MSTASISYREYPAPADLAAAIDCFWLLEADAGPTVNPAPALPDGCPELIIHLGDPVIHVPDGRPAAVQPTGRNRVLGVRFRPGGAAVWFGPRQRELTDTSLPLETWSPAVARELVGRAAEAATPAGAVGGVGAVLRRIARRGEPDPVVLRASHLIRDFRSFAGDTPGRLVEAAQTLTWVFTRPRMTDSSNTRALDRARLSRCD